MSQGSFARYLTPCAAGIALVAAQMLASSAALCDPAPLGRSESGSGVPSEHFYDEIERDIPLRALGKLHITNARGSISVQGWSQDRIRIRAKRRARAESKEEANKLLSAVDFRFGHLGEEIELSAEYGRGLQLAERVRERENRRTEMDMVIFAPTRLPLRVWTIEGDVSIRKWNASVEVRASSGSIRIEEVKAENVSVLCPTCPITARSIDASLRCIGGSGTIDILGVTGSQTYVETDSGSVRVSRIESDQLYVSKSGSIAGRELNGQIEFHTLDGGVTILESMGYLSGRTETGNVVAKMRRWDFADKALLESVRGDISLTVPGSFFGEVDVASASGKAHLGFPLEKTHRKNPVPATTPNRHSGRVGKGGELLKIFSEKGNVQLLRGSAS